MTCFKMHMVPLWTYKQLASWSDIEMTVKDGQWVLRDGGHDPMLKYINALDQAITSGIVDAKTLKNLRDDIAETRDEFIKIKLEGMTEDKEGGES